MASNLQLQTSLTFQFVLAQSTYPRLARPENSRPNLELVHRTLRLPLDAICTSCGKAHQFYLRLRDFDETLDESKWHVAVDRDTAPAIDEVDALRGDQKYFHIHGIKLATRIFSNDLLETEEDRKAPSHIHTINMKCEITAVLQQLQRRLSKLYRGSQMWLFPSSKSNIDVHFHNPMCALPFTTTKNTAFIMVAWQRFFDSLHSAHRITDRPLFATSFGTDLDAWLEHIDGAPGLGSLDELMRSAKAAKVLDVSDKNKITFGQLASTFDSATVIAWFDLLSKVILKATEGTCLAGQFSDEGVYCTPTYTTNEMLRDLHVKKSTVNHYKSRSKEQFTQLDEDLASALEATGRGDLLGPLAMHVANKALATSNAAAVKDKVSEKLNEGGYGSFDKDFIDAVGAVGTLPSEAKEERDSWTLV